MTNDCEKWLNASKRDLILYLFYRFSNEWLISMWFNTHEIWNTLSLICLMCWGYTRIPFFNNLIQLCSIRTGSHWEGRWSDIKCPRNKWELFTPLIYEAGTIRGPFLVCHLSSAVNVTIYSSVCKNIPDQPFLLLILLTTSHFGHFWSDAWTPPSLIHACAWVVPLLPEQLPIVKSVRPPTIRPLWERCHFNVESIGKMSPHLHLNP